MTDVEKQLEALEADRGRLVRDEWKTQRDELYATCKRAVVALDKGAAFIASRELDAAIQWYRVVSARDTLPLNDHHPYGDVLAALRDARELIRREYPDASLAAGNWPTVKPRIDALDAAIAKAEGNRDAAFVELEHAEADVARLVRQLNEQHDDLAYANLAIQRKDEEIARLVRQGEGLRALIVKWRTLGEFFATNTDPHQRDGAKLLKQCADELEAALAASPVIPSDSAADLGQRAQAYMAESMAMPDSETDQEQNWIFGHLVTFAHRVLDVAAKGGQ